MIESNNYFWVNNGAVLQSVSDLLNSLKTMDDSTFSHHVNEEKNDFYNWVKFVFKDEVLAEKLMSNSKDEMILAIEKNLNVVMKKDKRKSKKSTISKIKEAYQHG